MIRTPPECQRNWQVGKRRPFASAGARFTVIRCGGKSILVTNRTLARSRLSRTGVGQADHREGGKPVDTSTSAWTAEASTPNTAAVRRRKHARAAAASSQVSRSRDRNDLRGGDQNVQLLLYRPDRRCAFTRHGESGRNPRAAPAYRGRTSTDICWPSDRRVRVACRASFSSTSGSRQAPGSSGGYAAST